MIDFNKQKNRSDLAPWPPIEELEETRVVSGAPKHFSRLDVSEYVSGHMLGIWECVEGVVEWIELGDELHDIISLSLRITEKNGTPTVFSVGKVVFTQKGEQVRGEVLLRVRKKHSQQRRQTIKSSTFHT